MKDLGVEDVPLELYYESSADIGIANRNGLGKLRHLQVHLLRVQEQLRNKFCSLNAVRSSRQTRCPRRAVEAHGSAQYGPARWTRSFRAGHAGH